MSSIQLQKSAQGKFDCLAPLKSVKSHELDSFLSTLFRLMTRIFAFCCLLLLGLFIGQAEASTLEAQNIRHAFAALDAGHADQAASIASHINDQLLYKIFRAYQMAQPGNDVGYEEMASFVRDNPDWPGIKGILAIAEQKIPLSTSPVEVVSWLAAYPPQTLVGFYRYIDALDVIGQTKDVHNLIRTRWVEGEFGADELTAFHARFERFLQIDDHWERLDRLLWNNDTINARRMYNFATPEMKTVAEARISLSTQASNADDLANHVPSSWQDDPGFLYQRLRWRVRNNLDDEANEMLLHAPAELGRPDAWWNERNIMIHRAMDQHNYNLAYKLAADHGQTTAKSLVQAEFLAGWLALRFLDKPSEAQEHFEVLFDSATTPISRARGAYWLGRAYEVLNNKIEAEQSYETAAALNTTFYGQLAATRLWSNPILSATSDPPIPPNIRDKFFRRDIIRAIGRLYDVGEYDRASVFFKTVIDSTTQRADFVLLTELAYRIKRPDLAIETVKAANQRNMLIASGGFPVLEHHVPMPPEPAFTYALIRQESMFDPNAGSPVGARGLMQLMPHTAHAVAKHMGIKYKDAYLTDPNYNLRLGTAFVQSELNQFDGSYVLALAGYNAGPGRVHEWLSQIGDPRNAAIDPVDWIESIPVPETRNYVQRIIENLQVYRARLNGGHAPLSILKDLKR